MKHPIEKMRKCLALLPPPGGEVVAECLDEIELLRQQLADNDLFELDHNKWRNNYRRELAKLTEQITLLRTVMNRIAYSRTGQCTDLAQELFAREEWAAEALAATEPK